MHPSASHRLPSERSFGLSVGSVCIAFGLLAWWRGHTVVAPVLVGSGTLLVLVGLVAPSALRTLNRVWWRFAQTLGWVNARVILTAFFVLVVTPAGVIMRLLGQNPLRGAAASSNWGPYPARRRDPKHYERLY